MDIQTFLLGILSFLNKSLIPFILAVAFLIFIINIVRYFIIGGSETESQEQARSLSLWGISAFVLIVSIWGIVNLLVAGFGFQGSGPITPDYMCEKGGGVCVGNNSAPIPIAPPSNDIYNDALPQEL